MKLTLLDLVTLATFLAFVGFFAHVIIRITGVHL